MAQHDLHRKNVDYKQEILNLQDVGLCVFQVEVGIYSTSVVKYRLHMENAQLLICCVWSHIIIRCSHPNALLHMPPRTSLIGYSAMPPIFSDIILAGCIQPSSKINHAKESRICIGRRRRLGPSVLNYHPHSWNSLYQFFVFYSLGILCEITISHAVAQPWIFMKVKSCPVGHCYCTPLSCFCAQNKWTYIWASYKIRPCYSFCS